MPQKPAQPAVSDTGDPLLLTPGPLTTGKRVKEVMVHDWGSRDATFLKINSEVLTRLPEVVNGGADYVTVPMQGSGTFAVEAMLTTFVPPAGKVLMLINGAYGHRAKKILDIARRATVVHETPEDTPPDLGIVERLLKEDAAITHIFTVHCETTSGVLNPIAAIGALAQKYRKAYLIDSMSAFGALPLDAQAIKPDAIAASSNKCIEGVPGLGFVICRKAALEATTGNATTLVLDLHDQWRNFEKTGQYRFTPPIHVIVSFHQALVEFFEEGGQPGRLKRYCRELPRADRGHARARLRAAARRQSAGADHRDVPHAGRSAIPLPEFYDRLKERGYVIYPGKLTVADSFRIGCIGRSIPTICAARSRRSAIFWTRWREVTEGGGVRQCRSSPRKRDPEPGASWIPACAGMSG
jgi:2-aminoethylphosphonate-pyruvate transaminase